MRYCFGYCLFDFYDQENSYFYVSGVIWLMFDHGFIRKSFSVVFLISLIFSTVDNNFCLSKLI